MLTGGLLVNRATAPLLSIAKGLINSWPRSLGRLKSMARYTAGLRPQKIPLLIGSQVEVRHLSALVPEFGTVYLVTARHS